MPKKVKDGIRFISPKDFVGDTDIDFENAKMISYKDFERLSRKCKPQLGDFNIYPGLELLEKFKSLPDQNQVLTYVLIRPKLKISLKFLYYLMQSPRVITTSNS